MTRWRRHREDERVDLPAEWRRVGVAALFFAVCALLVILLGTVGL